MLFCLSDLSVPIVNSPFCHLKLGIISLYNVSPQNLVHFVCLVLGDLGTAGRGNLFFRGLPRIRPGAGNSLARCVCLLDICRISYENNYHRLPQYCWFNPMSLQWFHSSYSSFVVAWHGQPWSFRETRVQTKTWPWNPGFVEGVFWFPDWEIHQKWGIYRDQVFLSQGFSDLECCS